LRCKDNPFLHIEKYYHEIFHINISLYFLQLETTTYQNFIRYFTSLKKLFIFDLLINFQILGVMNSRIFLVLATVSLLIFSSCSKSTFENKLIGEWKQISLGGSHLQGKEITWTFNANGALYRTIVRDSGTQIDTAQWSVENRFAQKNTLSITNLDPDIDGKHLIHQLDNYLSIQRIEFENGHTDGSFQWNEFER